MSRSAAPLVGGIPAVPPTDRGHLGASDEPVRTIQSSHRPPDLPADVAIDHALAFWADCRPKLCRPLIVSLPQQSGCRRAPTQPPRNCPLDPTRRQTDLRKLRACGGRPYRPRSRRLRRLQGLETTKRTPDQPSSSSCVRFGSTRPSAAERAFDRDERRPQLVDVRRGTATGAALRGADLIRPAPQEDPLPGGAVDGKSLARR